MTAPNSKFVRFHFDIEIQNAHFVVLTIFACCGLSHFGTHLGPAEIEVNTAVRFHPHRLPLRSLESRY